MGLRDAVVESVAEVFRDAGHDEPFATSYATFSVDAVLGVLADRADEWGRAYWGDLGHPDAEPPMEEGAVPAIAGRLVAVLRGDPCDCGIQGPHDVWVPIDGHPVGGEFQPCSGLVSGSDSTMENQ